jgi:hypothetical protein
VSSSLSKSRSSPSVLLFASTTSSIHSEQEPCKDAREEVQDTAVLGLPK